MSVPPKIHRAPSSLQRRRFLRLTGLFSGAVALSATGFGCQLGRNLRFDGDRNTGQSDDRVRIGYLPITDSAPLLVAHEKRLLQQEGLESLQPQLYRSWGAIAKAFVERQVNVIHVLMPTSLWLRYHLKFPGKVVAWNHTNGSALTVHPSIQTPRELGGRTLAIPSWYSIHNVVLQLLLSKYGLTPVPTLPSESGSAGSRPAAHEVGLVVLPPPDMLKALARQDIAGYIVAEPFNSAAETAQVGRILRLTGDVWRDHACCVVFMHEDDLRDRPQWTQGVVNAIVNAQQWARWNRPELAHLLSQDGGGYIPHSVDVLDRVLNRHNHDAYRQSGAIQHPEWRSRRIDFQPFPFPSYTTDLVQCLQNTLLDDAGAFIHQLDPAFVTQDLVDDRFVTHAIHQRGGPQVFGLSQDLSRVESLDI